MLKTLTEAAIPVCFCVLVGWMAARLSILDRDRVRPISVFVVTFALPAALFVGTFKFTVAQLAHWQNLAVLLIAMGTVWTVAFLFGRLVLRISSGEAAILALNSSYPDMAYLGIPLLTALFSAVGLLPAILGNIVSSFILIPLTIGFLHRQGPKHGGGKSSLAQDLGHTLVQPLVWAPILAVVMVLVGIGLPALAGKTINLIGQAAGGTALFALGILLFGYSFRLDREVVTVFVLKNLAEPALAAGLVLAFGLHGAVAKGIVVVVACPCATASAMFSSSYGVAEKTTAAAVVVSTATSLLTLTGWIIVSEAAFGK